MKEIRQKLSGIPMNNTVYINYVYRVPILPLFKYVYTNEAIHSAFWRSYNF